MAEVVRRRILQIQQKLTAQEAFAAIFFSTDPHISEYVAERWKVRSWISGFCGSAGIVVVTRLNAALWTDSRYFLEAEQSLKGSGIVLMKEGLSLTIEEWISKEYREQGEDCEGRVLVDGETCTHSQFNELTLGLSQAGLVVEAADNILVDIWQGRPLLPAEEIYEISSVLTGESREVRLSRLKKILPELGVSAFLVSALDELAWVLNLRGSDVQYNPVFYGYLLVSERETILCTHHKDIPPAICSHLVNAGVRLAEYDDIHAILNEALRPEEGTKPAESRAKQGFGERGAGRIIGADPSSVNMNIVQLLGEDLKTMSSPLKLWKAQKTMAEIGSTRRVMEQDGVAMVKLLHWLEVCVENDEEMSELKVSDRIRHFRAERDGFISESFTSIVGFQGNAAVIHYSVDENSNKTIKGKGILLIDSGGQYRGGTTDITRTLAIGEAPARIQTQYSLVLKGHIQLAQAIFPVGSTGMELDSFARQVLWAQGLNYGHGTGHGVGFALNVHEGPQNISPRPLPVALEEGMICSNEPGYYEEGSHGIRIENLLLVNAHHEYQGFLCFETLSLCPLEINLIKRELLTDEEIAWVNGYHQLVWDRLSPLLSESDRIWLKQKTRQL